MHVGSHCCPKCNMMHGAPLAQHLGRNLRFNGGPASGHRGEGTATPEVGGDGLDRRGQRIEPPAARMMGEAPVICADRKHPLAGG